MTDTRKQFFSSSLPQRTVLFAGIAIMVFLTGYIVQVNASSTKAYALRDATRQYDELMRTNDRLGAEIDRLRSLSSVMDRKAFLDLVPVQSITYIAPDASGSLAMK